MEIRPAPSTTEELAHIPQAALKVSLGGMLSLVMGLGCQVATAYLFGAGADMDAFFTASVIPVYLQLVLLGGLPFVVIPAFVREETSGNSDEAWALAGTVFKVTVLILSIVAIASSLAASGIVILIAPNFSPPKSELTTRMLAVMMFTIPFFGMGYLTSGVQNIRNRWFWPAAATAVGSFGNLLILIFFYRPLGPMALAWGSLLAAIIQATVTTVPFLRHGWIKGIPVKDPRIVEIGKLISPFIIFGLFTCSKLILERYFASGLPDGQLSYMGYANKIGSIFVVLLASSIASAIFPSMARAYSREGMKGLVDRTDYGLKITLAVALPAVAIISFLAIPLVTVIYQRGEFQYSTTLGVCLIIPFVMVNEVLFRMVNNIFGRTFYILKDTLTVNLVQSLTISLYIVSAIVLTRIWGYVGLAFAQLVQVGPTLLILGYLLYRRIRPYPIYKFINKAFAYGLASLAAALVGWGITRLLSHTPAIVQLGLGLLVSGSIYLFFLYLIDHEIAMAVLAMTGVIKAQVLIKRICQKTIKPIFQSYF